MGQHCRGSLAAAAPVCAHQLPSLLGRFAHRTALPLGAGRVRVSDACTVSLRCAGATVQVGVDPSKVVVTKLKIDADRKRILDRKSKTSAAEKGKGKFTEKEVAMANVD